jgi:hypothetical protein
MQHTLNDHVGAGNAVKDDVIGDRKASQATA